MNAKTTTATDELTLSLEAASDIREALLIGLTSFGLIAEADNACQVADMGGKPWPEQARPIHPTGRCDTVSKFATALSFLDNAERSARGITA